MLKQFTEAELLDRPLSNEQLAEILALSNVKDEDIDTSDIPEVRELPPGTIPGLYYRGRTIRLTPELRDYFVELARRRSVPMNTLVNEFLMKAVALAETLR
jgi:hypothetical protein